MATPKAEALPTTLNPLFSEQDIAFQKSLSQQWQKKVDFYSDLLQKTEKEEIRKYQSSGKDKAEFTASSKLKSLILRNSVAITGRNITEAKAERMIEANISILNGKSISEASEDFHNKHDGIPWENTNLDAEAWSGEPEIREELEKDFLARYQYWQGSWQHILDETDGSHE
jgi:flagellar basal body rod protein FlgB